MPSALRTLVSLVAAVYVEAADRLRVKLLETRLVLSVDLESPPRLHSSLSSRDPSAVVSVSPERFEWLLLFPLMSPVRGLFRGLS